MKKHVALRCVLSLATALLLALSPFTAALAEPSSETILLAEGTAAETQARIDDSGVEGQPSFSLPVRTETSGRATTPPMS